MEELDEHAFNSYMKAGQAVAHALKIAPQLAKPNTKLIDFATILEKDILNNGAEGLAFPANVSLDVEAAHYSPIIDDERIIPGQGLLKVDLGAHVDGYVADAAITINIGNDSGVYETLVKATKEALYAAIGHFKVGVDVTQIGAIIEAEIQKYPDLTPISNLGGHQLKQWSLHAGTFVPNVARGMGNYIIQEGDQFAIEPFATNGYGAVVNGKNMPIYRVKNYKKAKKLPMEEKLRLRKFKDKFTSFPFSPRWIDFMPKKDVSKVIDKYMRKHILEGYYVFLERNEGLVSQAEHTVVIKDGLAIPTTWWEDFDYTTLYR